jgi:hypothetical protein
LPVANGGTGITSFGAGVATFLGTPSSANLAAAVTNETGSGSLVFATSPSLSTPSLSAPTFSTSATVTAGTNAQGQGAITSDFNVITTTAANPSGVTLPTATTGRKVIIVNKGTNPVNVYPATGAAIDALATNVAISLPVNEVLEFNAASTTRWYSTINSATSVDALIGTVAATQGGTGQSSYAVGDLLFASTTTALSKLADVATGNALISGGVGVAPSYGKIGLTTHVSGTLPIANGGTGSTSTTFVNLATNVTGTLPVARGGTGITSFGAGVATFLGTPSSANLAAAVTNETGSGALVFATSPTLVTPALGTPSSGNLANCTFPTLNQNTTGSAATVTGNATGSTFGFNSGYGSVATAYGCRAWVNFNGTGTVAIRASGNVSSITDNGTGDYTVNFIAAMPNVNYATCANAGPAPATGNYSLATYYFGGTYSTSAVQIATYRQASGTPTLTDYSIVSVAIFR